MYFDALCRYVTALTAYSTLTGEIVTFHFVFCGNCRVVLDIWTGSAWRCWPGYWCHPADIPALWISGNHSHNSVHATAVCHGEGGSWMLSSWATVSVGQAVYSISSLRLSLFLQYPALNPAFRSLVSLLVLARHVNALCWSTWVKWCLDYFRVLYFGR